MLVLNVTYTTSLLILYNDTEYWQTCFLCGSANNRSFTVIIIFAYATERFNYTFDNIHAAFILNREDNILIQN